MLYCKIPRALSGGGEDVVIVDVLAVVVVAVVAF